MGPLTGVKVVELAGIGPGPFCGMMLADMGAEVIRVERASNVPDEMPEGSPPDVSSRGKSSIGVDLKNPAGVETVLRLIEGCDVLIEGFRPGVTERMGLGPDVCLARNPALVYGRMTGWGQDGPYALAAGHDINYIALSGVLSMIGRKGEGPVPPLNLVGDFGGGGMFLAFGVAAALVSARSTGQGQVVDAAMVDGAAVLAAMFSSMTATGMWLEERGSNMLDTGSHFYDVYECSDGEYVSIGSIEPQFYSILLDKLGLDPADLPRQHDANNGRRSRSRLPRSSRPRRVTNGPRSWSTPTSVMRQSSTGAKRRIIRTTPSAPPSSTSKGSPSQRLLLASAAHQQRCRPRHRSPARTPTTRLRRSASRPTNSARFETPVLLPDGR